MGERILELIRDIWSFNGFGFWWAIILGAVFFLLKILITIPKPSRPAPKLPASTQNIEIVVKTEAEIRASILEAETKYKEQKKQEKSLRKVYYVLVAIAVFAAIGLIFILIKRLS